MRSGRRYRCRRWSHRPRRKRRDRRWNRRGSYRRSICRSSLQKCCLRRARGRRGQRKCCGDGRGRGCRRLDRSCAWSLWRKSRLCRSRGPRGRRGNWSGSWRGRQRWWRYGRCCRGRFRSGCRRWRRSRWRSRGFGLLWRRGSCCSNGWRCRFYRDRHWRARAMSAQREHALAFIEARELHLISRHRSAIMDRDVGSARNDETKGELVP